MVIDIDDVEDGVSIIAVGVDLLRVRRRKGDVER